MLQHCQVVVLQEELGSQFTIGSINYVYSWQEPAYVESFSMSMAHIDNDELTDTFASNYEPGSLVEVCFMDTLELPGGVGDGLEIVLDTPFHYNGQDNLLIDIYYPDGECYSQVYNWVAGENRCLRHMFCPSGGSSPTGDLVDYVPYMVFETPESFQETSFGAVKTELGTVH